MKKIKIAYILMFFTMLSKILGFGRSICLSVLYGATNVTDAYLISQNIPITIFGMFTMAIMTGYIPTYSKVKEHENEVEADKFTSNLINIFLILATGIIMIILINPRFFIKLFASGMSDETITLATKFLNISVFIIYFLVLISIFSGYLNIKGKFVITQLGGVPLNIILVSSIIISYLFKNVYLIGIGNLVAHIVNFLILYFAIKKSGYKHKLCFSIKDENIKELVLMAIPVMIGTATNDINVLIDNALASYMKVGGISIINYSTTIISMVETVFISSFITVLFPEMCSLYQKRKMESIFRIINKGIVDIFYIIIPIVFFSFFYSNEIIQFLFGYGNFTNDSIIFTSECVKYGVFGIIGYAIRELFSKSFYASHDMKTPIINTIVAVIINIILNFIFSYYMGLSGLCLATSVSIIFSAVLLLKAYKDKYGYKVTCLKQIVLYSMFSFVGCYLIRSIFNEKSFGNFLISGITYMIPHLIIWLKMNLRKSID